MKRLLGGILVAVGVLMMTGSGICTITVITGSFANSKTDLSIIPLAVFVGAIPFVVGFALFRVGRKCLQESAEETE